MKIGATLAIFMLVSTNAFSLQPKTHLSMTTTFAVKGADEQNAPMNFFGSFALASILALGVTPPPALATEATPVVSQPSLLISDSIKTLDMSLPTYDDVSDAAASVETVESLSVDVTIKADRGRKKDSEPSEKVNKKKEAAAAKQRAREEFEETLGGKKVETVDVSVPSYGDSTSQQQRSSFSL